MTEIRNGRLSEDEALPEPAEARGVFETVLVAQGRPVFFREHAERFAAGCAHFGLAKAPGSQVLQTAAADLIRGSGLSYGVLRWAAWTTGPAEEWRLRVDPPRPQMGLAAWKLAVSPLRLPPPDGAALYKHMARGRWREALAAGRAAGCDEVLLADGAGRIVEGAISNVFWVKGGALFTPPVARGLLPGIIRAKVLALAAAEGLAAGEREMAVGGLPDAAEVFLTNSLVGIRPAGWLDGRDLPAPGPVTLRLQAAWRRLHGWGG